MTTDLYKNYSRLGEYFSFWNSLAESSKAITDYMFKNNFIARFIDFLLENKSPVKIFPKSLNLSNNRYCIPYGDLVKTVATLVKVSKAEHPNPTEPADK